MEIGLLLILQDQDGVSHRQKPITFADETTIKELSKAINSFWCIHQNYQELYHNGKQIISLKSTLKQIGVKDDDEIVIYKKAVGIAMKAGPERMENAKEAVKLHTRLLEKGFFNVYSSFNEFRMENHHKVASWTDGNTELMREATVNHFRALHFKRGADDEFTKNTLAYVQLHGEKEETKYNVKCHHFGSSSNSAKGQSPDIKEFFCYKLLELINVGPHAQFILPNKLTGRRTSMYIATKWCDNFVPISHIEEEDVSADILVQILLLGTFLFIDDLHSDNCGQWKGTKEAAIVDFMPRAYTSYTNVKKALLDNSSSVYWEAIHIDALEKCNEKSRLEMAKECLKKWDLLSKIEMANEQIKLEKDRMKRQDIGFKGFNSPTEELDQYIIAVKENLTKLTVIGPWDPIGDQRFIDGPTEGPVKFSVSGSLDGDEWLSSGFYIYMEIWHNCVENKDDEKMLKVALMPPCPIEDKTCTYTLKQDITNKSGDSELKADMVIT
ncbi:unnamed protein product [Caenorhabditis bovis]|uniref:Ubiquitin-like domain-containing protein n=1 Tax=Caenorhabditis bovis TaxID=2654633 RepID=A0A8S1EW79_9PELO|nr:unnamed protein product [Caenorhabditis bovis]